MNTFGSTITYNTFANGELIYLGYDKELALNHAAIAKEAGKRVKVRAVGNGYAYEVETDKPLTWSEVEA